MDASKKTTLDAKSDKNSGTGPMWRQHLRARGPGLVTGASDYDPSGIASRAQAGAKFTASSLVTVFLRVPSKRR
jgi:Mn2+/Fe2+ NRAMP family transporter